MYSKVIERAKNDRIVWDLRSGERSGTVSAHDHLDGTIFSALPPVDRRKSSPYSQTANYLPIPSRTAMARAEMTG
jgi:hypothetical protein